jgi:hypothetical protein
MPPMGPADADTKDADEQGAVMELVVYGYATFYERFPPKPAVAQNKPGAPPARK